MDEENKLKIKLKLSFRSLLTHLVADFQLSHPQASELVNSCLVIKVAENEIDTTPLRHS